MYEHYYFKNDLPTLLSVGVNEPLVNLKFACCLHVAHAKDILQSARSF